LAFKGPRNPVFAFTSRPDASQSILIFIQSQKTRRHERAKILFVIHCIDHDGSLEKRMSRLDAHKAYVANSPIKTVISGPLLADDNNTMIGSMFMVEADSKEAVVAFNVAIHSTRQASGKR
jgi:uncharacterized protein YciI